MILLDINEAAFKKYVYTFFSSFGFELLDVFSY